MAKVNKMCVKTVAIAFNVLFGVLGCLLLGVALYAMTIYDEVDEEDYDNFHKGRIAVLVIGTIILIMSCLGALGAYLETQWVLILYIILTGIGLVILLIFAVPLSILKSSILDSGPFTNNMTMDHAHNTTKEWLESVQQWAECCGWENGYQDWGQNIPDSCLCDSNDPDSPKCHSVSNHTVGEDGSSVLSSKVIFSEPCALIYIGYMENFVNVIIGIYCGLVVIDMIGMVLSIMMICQIKKHIPTSAFYQSPPTYSDLNNKPLC
ncbi:tetraspanin-8 [Amia ocellicauda]|uniref:tetraspanin-8 n=1 Tax=Amia ocellicauda TaxID=2972642 RepID=UPI0034640BFC